jgi:hypothetical protein
MIKRKDDFLPIMAEVAREEYAGTVCFYIGKLSKSRDIDLYDQGRADSSPLYNFDRTSRVTYLHQQMGQGNNTVIFYGM